MDNRHYNDKTIVKLVWKMILGLALFLKNPSLFGG
jgi:hypothetical protein